MFKYKISFSEYSTFKRCPHKWYLSNCLGKPGDENIELIFGSALHKTIEETIQKPFFKKQTTWLNLFKDNLKKEIEKIKNVDFLNRLKADPDFYRMPYQAYDLLKTLDFHNRFSEYEVFGVEYLLDDIEIVSFNDIKFVYKGYIDLILKHKLSGKYVFIDWKSSLKPWNIENRMKDNKDLFGQLGFYKLFFHKKEGIELDLINAQFYNLPRGEHKAQLGYSGIINEAYCTYLFEDLQDVCTKIYKLDFKRLDKEKHHNKKNYCFRCAYNTPELCNDDEQFQIII